MNAVREFIRARPAGWRLPARNFAVALVVGAVLGRIGPMGTFEDLEAAARYGYWIVLTALLWVQMAAAFALIRRVPALSRVPWPLPAVLAGLVGALPATFQVAWAESLLRVGGVLTPWSMVETYGDVCLFALAIAVPMSLFRGLDLLPEADATARTQASGSVGAHADVPGMRPAASSAFLARLPPRLGGRILAVQAEDHYLRVHTDAGSDLVLCRMADAEAELKAMDGMRVHRSWWVARDGVERCLREGERTVLHLRTGLRVPVSRSYLLAAREAGIVPAEGRGTEAQRTHAKT